MDRNIFEIFPAPDSVPAEGLIRATIFRENGTIERHPWIHNSVTAAGLNTLAAKAIVTSHSAGFNVIAIGSGTDVSSLGSTLLTHEVGRKAASTAVTSQSLIVLVSSWGGSADGISSVPLSEAGIFNSVSSGQPTMLDRITSVNATLANSDTLLLECIFRIGSHNL